MALIQKNGRYIKLEIEEGLVEVIQYESGEMRKIEKTAMPRQLILDAYDTELKIRYNSMLELVEKYEILPEQEEEIPNLGHSDLTLAFNNYWECFYEKERYIDSIELRRDVGYLYPIINKLLGITNTQIRDTFIHGDLVMKLVLTEKTVECAYQEVKERKVFGDTVDA